MINVYYKWYIINITNKKAPETLHVVVGKGTQKKFKGNVFELNGVTYVLVSKGKLYTDPEQVNSAKFLQKILKAELRQIKGKLDLKQIIRKAEIEDHLQNLSYWKYQDIYVKKEK